MPYYRHEVEIDRESRDGEPRTAAGYSSYNDQSNKDSSRISSDSSSTTSPTTADDEVVAKADEFVTTILEGAAELAKPKTEETK